MGLLLAMCMPAVVFMMPISGDGVDVCEASGYYGDAASGGQRKDASRR